MTTLKKILIVGEPNSGKLTFLKHLTGSLPPEISGTGQHGGVTHELKITNQYYSAEIGIWVDEFTNIEELTNSYCSAEADEVRASIGVLIVTFRKSQQEEDAVALVQEEKVGALLGAIKSVVDLCPSETLALAVGCPGSSSAGRQDEVAWEDVCAEEGFEYIDLEATGKNVFGERTGLERAKEAIEACDWSEQTIDPSEEGLLASMMAEDAAINKHLLEDDLDTQGADFEEASVEQLESMIQRVMIARGKA